NVTQYLKDENAYTEKFLGTHESLQKRLFEELKSRVVEDDATVPVKKGEYEYYSRYEKGKQYRIYCRKKTSGKSSEQILLDVNQLTQGKTFCSIGVFEVSHDHKLLAYSVDLDGSEKYTLYIKNLESGELLKEKIENTSTSFVWFQDDKTFLYNVLDKNLRPFTIYRHHLGGDVSADELLYEEKSSEYFAYCYETKSEEYIILYIHGAITTECYFLDSKNASSKPKLILERKRGHDYLVEHHADDFYIRTNDIHHNFRIVKTSVSLPSKENWKEVVTPLDQGLIQEFQIFKNFFVTFERKDALTQIRIHPFGKMSYYVPLHEPVYRTSLHDNPEFDSTQLRFSFDSLITPEHVYDFNIETCEKTLKKKKEIPHFQSELYETKRIYVKSWDGLDIPIDLAFKKGLMDQAAKPPVYLYGYGSYGLSIDPYFSSNRISLLDRGFIFALAHIRGGSCKGRQWYLDGKFLKKKNTFKDFLSAAQGLVDQGYTTAGNIAIAGGSAGGMLIGACVNMKPELFKVAVAHVPFVDTLNTMLDKDLPLTQIEYDEWGNPQNKEYFDYIRSYSPYDNIEKKNYPHILAMGGLNDPRVCYWEPAKWIAKLRDYKTDKNEQLLYIKMDSGHGGASGRYELLKEIALEYTFIFKIFNISK
ncbi:MAG: S9 family peptidase, partial [Deltaproteobacteria bacterium]|nr:S9 family peptidase [Deltaproteobacteria bacterium]